MRGICVHMTLLWLACYFCFYSDRFVRGKGTGFSVQWWWKEEHFCIMVVKNEKIIMSSLLLIRFVCFSMKCQCSSQQEMCCWTTFCDCAERFRSDSFDLQQQNILTTVYYSIMDINVPVGLCNWKFCVCVCAFIYIYIYKIAHTLIHSVFYVLNFMLPVYGPNFAEVALTPQKQQGLARPVYTIIFDGRS